MGGCCIEGSMKLRGGDRLLLLSQVSQDMLGVGEGEAVEEQVRHLAQDPEIRRVIEQANKKDVMVYWRAVMEFKRRCRYFGIPVPDDPYLLDG
ncbi:expressed unknown protein [Ectocarpus siliculosus]|uniref:Uncharacterized protein n=1 Tax=Ectocarpus siliculosus TaxID=2880 RepID=D7G6F3_ECTSI|nr:expressed unknown protein [Ectocarpus siliculosus]|eukprot:CBJ27548.1 expressed unknown protein [Ectocarpus siliculosus]